MLRKIDAKKGFGSLREWGFLSPIYKAENE